MSSAPLALMVPSLLCTTPDAHGKMLRRLVKDLLQNDGRDIAAAPRIDLMQAVEPVVLKESTYRLRAPYVDYPLFFLCGLLDMLEERLTGRFPTVAQKDQCYQQIIERHMGEFWFGCFCISGRGRYLPRSVPFNSRLVDQLLMWVPSIIALVEAKRLLPDPVGDIGYPEHWGMWSQTIAQIASAADRLTEDQYNALRTIPTHWEALAALRAYVA